MATVKFSVTIGALIRRIVINRIKDYAWQRDYGVTVDESRGLLDSSYRIKMEVPNGKEQEAINEIQGYLESLGGRS